MPDCALAYRLHHLKSVGGRARGFEQRERRRLGVEGVEGHRLADLPAARALVARHQQRQRRMFGGGEVARSEEHTSELQSLMRISYAVFCLKKKKMKYSTK